MKAYPIRLTYPALSTNSLTEIWLKRENKSANQPLKPIAAPGAAPA